MNLRLGIASATALVAMTLGSSAPALVAAQPAISSDLAARVTSELGFHELSFVSIELPETGTPASFAVVIDVEGDPLALQLQRRSLRSPGYRLRVQESSGQLIDHTPPPVRTYRGTVDGVPGARAAASLLEHGLYAGILLGDGLSWTVRPARQFDPSAPRALHVVFRDTDAPAFDCGSETLHDATRPTTDPAPSTKSQAAMVGGGGADDPCELHVADAAFDSDYEFFVDDCEESPDTCSEIVETGLNITNLMYERDVRITHRLSALIVRTDAATDFWAQYPDASDFGDMLVAFRSEWNTNRGDLDYDVAYYLTGKPKPNYGGLAYVGVVCSSSRYGMGIGRWGYEGIFRHEVGHNWGAGHSCGAERRYIMCGNSISAISAYNIGVMTRHRDSRSCLEIEPYASEPEPPFVRLAPIDVLEGSGPVTIPLVRGDTDRNCDVLSLASVDDRSAFGATIIPADPLDEDDPLEVLYLPRSGLVGTDFFRYRVADDTGFEETGQAIVRIRPRGLVVWLPLDETAGQDAEEVSGSGHDGELRDELSFDTDSTPGRFGSALQFSGVDGEYVSLGDDSDFDLQSAITVSVWFRVDALGATGGEILVAKGDDAWRLKRDGTRRALRFTCTGVAIGTTGSDDLAGTAAIDDGEWHHAAAVYDGNEIALYIDGELDRSLPATGRIARNSSSLRIGDDEWNGPIDDVRIYNFGMSSADVASLYDDARVEGTRPPDRATTVTLGTRLSWTAAPSATAHDVYVGTNRAAVTAADTASPEYERRMTGTSFAPALEPGATYYWRVDEVTGGVPRQGAVRSFTTSFAFTDFDEPRLSSGSYSPGAGDRELGFRTETASTGGDNPLAEVVATSSTPTTPILAHRSLRATTTFDAVDLSERGGTVVALELQARSTGYEEEDHLEVFVSNGAERVDLLGMPGGAALSQLGGAGYHTYAGYIPAAWDEASLVLSTSSNSSSGNERYDFDSVGFACLRLDTVLAHSYFSEPEAGARSYTPTDSARELGFETTAATTGGAGAFAGVVKTGDSIRTGRMSSVSVSATTTFDAVDISGESDVHVTLVARVLSTGYESADLFAAYVTDGAESVYLLDIDGDSGLDGLATGDYLSFSTPVPDAWERATLVVETASNSSSASEGFDLRAIEFTRRSTNDPCEPEGPPPVTFIRADASPDGKVQITDGIRILNYLFGGASVDCLDAADADDTGKVEITDGVFVLNFLFAGGREPPAPGPFGCGEDPTPDSLGCAVQPPCP